MNSALLLQLALTVVLTVGAGATVTILLGTIRAEREWRRAAQHMSEEDIRLLLDLIEERRTMAFGAAGRRGFQRTYLASALAEAIMHLRETQQISQESAARMATVLRQPSETGRVLYADKLAREALKARAEVKQKHLIGA